MIGYASSVCPFFISYIIPQTRKFEDIDFFVFGPSASDGGSLSPRGPLPLSLPLPAPAVLAERDLRPTDRKACLFVREYEKSENLSILASYPLRGSTALLAVGSRVLAWTSLGGAISGFSPPDGGIKQKGKNFRSSLSVPPQGLEPWTPTLRVSCSTN